jgi:hypothetical protein
MIPKAEKVPSRGWQRRVWRRQAALELLFSAVQPCRIVYRTRQTIRESVFSLSLEDLLSRFFLLWVAATADSAAATDWTDRDMARDEEYDYLFKGQPVTSLEPSLLIYSP